MPLIPFSATTTLRTAQAQNGGAWLQLPNVPMSWLTIEKDGGGDNLEVAAFASGASGTLQTAGTSIVLGNNLSSTLYGSNANQFMIRKASSVSDPPAGVNAYLTIVNENR